MSKKGYIYSAIAVVIVVAIGAAHFLSKIRAATKSNNH